MIAGVQMIIHVYVPECDTCTSKFDDCALRIIDGGTGRGGRGAAAPSLSEEGGHCPPKSKPDDISQIFLYS